MQEYGILLISDEVQTGWGRTGEHLWGIQAHDVTPDAMTFAKGLGNGLAIGGVVARPELMDSLTANSISTFGGNPLSTAAAGRGAGVPALPRPARQRRQARRPTHRRVAGRRRQLLNCRGGAGQGADDRHRTDHPDGAPNRAATSAVHELAKQRGLLIGKGGLHGNVLRLSPPMTLTEAELDEGTGYPRRHPLCRGWLDGVPRQTGRPHASRDHGPTRGRSRALEIAESGNPTDLTGVTVDG